MRELPSVDTLMKMAKEDPEGLEKLKREMINEVIENAPEKNKERLKGLQFQIDMKIKSSKTPLESVSKIYSDMFDSFLDLNDKLSVFREDQNKKEVKEFPSYLSILKNKDKKNN